MIILQTGTLRIELTTGGALPVGDAIVRIKSPLNETLYEEFIPYGNDGQSSAFELEVPDLAESLDKNQLSAPYGTFNVEVVSGNFSRVNVNGVQVFAQREAILQIPLLPRNATLPMATPPSSFVIPPNGLRLPPQPEGDTSTLFPQSPSSQLHEFPYIPEFITVHLGQPTDFSAKNVTVTFQDYIKNVASSEIYPTWPEESLKANIIAQISFVLNRVYTEWYRSRGYDFDITNTTAFDQYFVEGRNIFDNISRLVDEIFNVYMKKEGREEPFFARYCNGTTSTCDGLSQWGTVTLANDGLDAEAILEYYYGEVELVQTDDIKGNFESYPGNLIQKGARGAPVRRIQEQLNRISLNYPSIPLIVVDGIYGSSTENSVRRFQKIFNLTPDGIVGKATWYAISRIYVAVKRLAELTSEGERVNYGAQEYPGRNLSLGEKSVEVLEIQLYLSTIALYNNEVKTVAIDGVYGESTLNSVVSFQRAYGLDPDGIVGRITWEKLVDVYNGIVENVNVPTLDNIELRNFPGETLGIGADGEDVVYLRNIINALSRIYNEIPAVSENGVFDETLSDAIRKFQELFSLAQTGVADNVTWNYLNREYQIAKKTPPSQTVIAESITEEAITEKAPEVSVVEKPSAPQPEKTHSKPKALGLSIPYERPLRVGSVGNDVQALKNALSQKGYLDKNAVSGDIFGIATRRAVEFFQRDAGLNPNGRVDKETWEEVFR